MKYNTSVKIVNSTFFENLKGWVIDIRSTDLRDEKADRMLNEYLVNFGNHRRWFLEINVVDKD